MACTNTTQAAEPCPLLTKLPAHFRQDIFRMIFWEGSDPFDLPTDYKPPRDLLQVCRTIREETKEIFLEAQVYEISNNFWAYPTRACHDREHLDERVRNVLIDLDPSSNLDWLCGSTPWSDKSMVRDDPYNKIRFFRAKGLPRNECRILAYGLHTRFDLPKNIVKSFGLLTDFRVINVKGCFIPPNDKKWAAKIDWGERNLKRLLESAFGPAEIVVPREELGGCSFRWRFYPRAHRQVQEARTFFMFSRMLSDPGSQPGFQLDWARNSFVGKDPGDEGLCVKDADSYENPWQLKYTSRTVLDEGGNFIDEEDLFDKIPLTDGLW